MTTEPGWGHPHTHQFNIITEIMPGISKQSCECGAPGPILIDDQRLSEDFFNAS